MTATNLNPGDFAMTDYCKKWRRVEITAVKTGRSQTGILYQVKPPLSPNYPDTWFDAGWFFPVTDNHLQM